MCGWRGKREEGREKEEEGRKRSKGGGGRRGREGTVRKLS